ncbi:MAG TPA: hypothetical protein VKB52_08710, partial [Rhodanobacteraceae bacterium]|nr:hypothetical protein [Rhodanobacteraceae bacterium]
MTHQAAGVSRRSQSGTSASAASATAAERAGRVADDARESVEHLPDRHHPTRHDAILQVRDEPRRLCDRLGECRFVHRRGELLQASARDDQLADEIHQRVEPVEIDPDVAMLTRRDQLAR